MKPSQWNLRWHELKLFIKDWSKAYPESVFKPIDGEPDDKVLSRDRISAHMGRHVTKSILEEMERLEKTWR